MTSVGPTSRGDTDGRWALEASRSRRPCFPRYAPLHGGGSWSPRIFDDCGLPAEPEGTKSQRTLCSQGRCYAAQCLTKTGVPALKPTLLMFVIAHKEGLARD